MNFDAMTPFPSSLDAEKSVLSVLLQKPERMTAALGDGLDAEYFWHPGTRGVWLEILEMHRAGEEIELVSLVERLRHANKLENVGGASEVTGIYSFIPTSAYWSQHVAILRDRLARRRMLKFAAKAEGLADDSTESVEDLAKLTAKASQDILATVTPHVTAKHAKEACKEFSEHFEGMYNSSESPGTPTGIDDLDMITGGMRPGEFWVIGGPTSGGKSVLCLQAANAHIVIGKKVGVFSLEMGAEENIARLISCGWGVDYAKLRNPRGGQPMLKNELINIRSALNDLGNAELTIWDEGGLTVERLETLARQWADTRGLDLLIVDYIQLLTTTGAKGEGRARELALISASLKQLAKKLHCPVVTGSQLNEEGKLRESRAVGQDADVVLRIEGEKGIYVLKNRNGVRHLHVPYVLEGARQKFIRAIS